MIRILITDSESLHMHRLRDNSRRAGLNLLYQCARTSDEFVRLLGKRPSAMAATLDGLGDLPFDDLVDAAAMSAVPLVVVGGDTAEERDRLLAFRGRFVKAIHRSQVNWLPLLLDRIVHERQAEQMERRALADAEDQIEQAAAQMREVQKMAVVGRLAGSIAHEINNPLESVTNLVYLLGADSALPDHLRPYLDLAQQELSRAAQITKQTLSFYRETLEPVRMLPSELLDEVCLLYSRRMAEKGVRLERRYESEDPLMLFPGEMRQVYANLLANAIEATAAVTAADETDGATGADGSGRAEGRERCIVVRVHRCSQLPANGREAIPGVRVVIADNGSGIPEAARARLGQPFYTTKGQHGTGLGLWVSQAIVKRHGGNMQLRSSVRPERRGTTFSIFLPTNLRPRMVEPSSTSAGKAPQDAQASRVRLRASSS